MAHVSRHPCPQYRQEVPETALGEPIWLGDCLCYHVETRMRLTVERGYTGDLHANLRIRNLKDSAVPGIYIAVVIAPNFRHGLEDDGRDCWLEDNSVFYEENSRYLKWKWRYREIAKIEAFYEFSALDKFVRRTYRFGAILSFLKIM